VTRSVRELERRLAGRWNHSVATVHNLSPVLATVLPGSTLRLLSLSHPQRVDAVFRRRTVRPTPWHEGQTSPVETTFMMFNVCFIRPPDHTLWFWLQKPVSNKSSFRWWKRHVWFYVSVKVVHCIFLFWVNTENSIRTGWEVENVVVLTPLDEILT